MFAISLEIQRVEFFFALDCNIDSRVRGAMLEPWLRIIRKGPLLYIRHKKPELCFKQKLDTFIK